MQNTGIQSAVLGTVALEYKKPAVQSDDDDTLAEPHLLLNGSVDKVHISNLNMMSGEIYPLSTAQADLDPYCEEPQVKVNPSQSRNGNRRSLL